MMSFLGVKMLNIWSQHCDKLFTSSEPHLLDFVNEEHNRGTMGVVMVVVGTVIVMVVEEQ